MSLDQLQCLQRALAKLKTISKFHERQVCPDDIEKWVLPALKQVYSGEGLASDERVAAIEAFAFSIASIAAENDSRGNLLSFEGKKVLGDILLNEEYTHTQVDLASDATQVSTCALPQTQVGFLSITQRSVTVLSPDFGALAT